jgi:hypothetical protein
LILLKLNLSARPKVRNFGVGILASRKRRFITSLSMPTAEPNTPAPTNGRLASLSKPWTVPSSPNGPCKMGKTTSTVPNLPPPTSGVGVLPGRTAAALPESPISTLE